MKLYSIKKYYADGAPRIAYTTNKDGNRHGTYQHWYPNGQLRTQEEWINGNRHGTCQFWYTNGQIWEQCEYVNGVPQGIRYFWAFNGSLAYIQQYDNGELLVEVDYISDNGRARKVVLIEVYDGVNIESTGFIANATTKLNEEGRTFKIKQK